ncbi:MAG: ATP-grasp domain-containing protein [Proteobacteria bacterium]|nr:ATP-grasp domain-containing protein [Pseudomonadota bacterium]
MQRRGRIEHVRRYLEGRNLLWVGTRATDAATLCELPELSGVVGIICPPDGFREGICVVCLESNTRFRLDLNTYDIDQDDSYSIHEVADLFHRQLSQPSIILSYRPSQFIASAVFPRQATVKHWGMFYMTQAFLEYKPWVESELVKIGVNTIPWRYYNNDDVEKCIREMRDCSFVMRTNRGAGGAGITIAVEAQDALEYCEGNRDGFFSASRFMETGHSLSVTAVVYTNGDVAAFMPSAQLIGIKQCTNRPLGFCGNDFAAVKDLPPSCFDKIESLVEDVGRWLRSVGYLGVFGVDIFVQGDEVFFVEINPRFTASSPGVSILCREMSLTDPYLEQIAAYNDLSLGRWPQLRELVKDMPRLSDIIVYNRGTGGIRRVADTLSIPEEWKIYEVPSPETTILPNGQMFRCCVRDRVSDQYRLLLPEVASIVERLTTQWIQGPLCESI